MGQLSAADFTDQVLIQCGFAMGAGAGMHIRFSALGGLQQHLRPHFKAVLESPKDTSNPQDPGPGEPRWLLVDDFILGCCEGIGRLAASLASTRGSIVIEKEDLKAAFNTVSDTNAAGVPGEFCPNWGG